MNTTFQVGNVVLWGEEAYLVVSSRRTKPYQNANATGWVDQYLLRPADDLEATAYWVDADELTLQTS